MTLANWLLFCGIALLTTFTPGPAVLLAISNSVSNGPRSALVCLLGNALGLFVVSGIAMAGMGVALALANPKAILFFSALLPQFLTPDLPLFEQFVVLTTSFSACAVLSHASYALLAHTLGAQFENPPRVRLFNRVSGGIFCFLGLGLLRLQRTA